MRQLLGGLLLCAWAIVWPSPPASAASGRIAGTVVDPAGNALPGVVVLLEAIDAAAGSDPSARGRPTAETTSEGRGQFAFENVPAGAYRVVVELTGYRHAAREALVATDGQSTEIVVALELAPISEVVNIVAAVAGEPLEQEQIRPEFLRTFQLPTDRFQEALPLLPGVVRDRRGRLSFNGTRPSQSALLVNGVNATDPVTGDFAVDLPLSVIDTVEVHAIPYSAEFGRVSGAVADVRTVAGTGRWDVAVDNIVPKPRFRDGTVMGINLATPRIKVSGPIRTGSAWFSQAFSYRFVRSRVEHDIPRPDEEVLSARDAFTQVDVKLSDRHAITSTLSWFPANVENLGIDTMHHARATPDLETSGWNVALADSVTTGAGTIWQTVLAVRRFDVEVRPKGHGPARLTPDGLFDNSFTQINRRSHQVEAQVKRMQNWVRGTSQHLLNVGGQLVATRFDGTDQSGPVDVMGAGDRLLQRISFTGSGELSGSDVVLSGYVQDRWTLNPRLALDLGLRFDHGRLLGRSHLAPRMAFSHALDARGATWLRGGWGRFFDKVFLLVDAFTRFQQRIEQDFQGAPDRPAGPPVIFQNRIDPTGLDEPRSQVWNVEIDRRIGPSLLMRVNYREHRASHRLIVDRTGGAEDPAGHPNAAAALGAPGLVLSSTGRLVGREFDTTLRWDLAEGSELFFSFSKIRSKGDLNDIGELYDTIRHPVFTANESSLQPFEAPKRILVWGTIQWPRGFTLTPGFEWRSGFPYTIYDEAYRPIGPRNMTEFPHFLSADLQVTKRVTLLGRRTDVGVQIYNLTGHDNPRDVVSNVASPSFGELRNSAGTKVALKVAVGF